MNCLKQSMTAGEIRAALEGIDDDAEIFVGVHRGHRPRRIGGEQGEIGSVGNLGIPLHNWYPVACLAQATPYDDIAPLVCDEKDLNNK